MKICRKGAFYVFNYERASISCEILSGSNCPSYYPRQHQALKELSQVSFWVLVAFKTKNVDTNLEIHVCWHGSLRKQFRTHSPCGCACKLFSRFSKFMPLEAHH